MDWNYYDTFITVAPDCPADRAIVPPEKKNGKTKHGIEYDLIASAPYRYTQEELLYQVHIRHKGYTAEELSQRGEQLRAEFFQKPKPCLRASMLPKKFGWGIHFDHEGKIALYAVDSPEYERFVQGSYEQVKLLSAMRNKRAR